MELLVGNFSVSTAVVCLLVYLHSDHSLEASGACEWKSAGLNPEDEHLNQWCPVLKRQSTFSAHT